MSVELHHRFEGSEDAPVLVLSNSLGTALDMWDDQAQALAEHFRLLRYDARGHGRSPVPEPPYAIADLGRDLLALLDAEDIGRASICGLSMGGMAGMWLAINAPDRVDRLALCCTSAHMPPPEAWDDRAATVRTDGMKAVVDATIERWFTPAALEERPEEIARIRQGVLDCPPQGYAACCEAIRDMDLRPELASITAPTLVIAGDEDPSTPPEEHGRVIADSVEGARMVVIERARHLANIEHPERITGELIDHLTAEAPA
jgi:3-oxoadipate enol-lactonase